MKNWKKYAAIIGVIALLMIFCLPMYFALKGDFSETIYGITFYGTVCGSDVLCTPYVVQIFE